MGVAMSAAKRIERALHTAAGPLTVDELCKAALGKVGARERNVVRVNLVRLDDRGLIRKIAAKFEIKPAR